MQYIVFRTFQGTPLAGGTLTLARGTPCEAIGSTIYCEGKEVCKVFSQNAYNYFAKNNDGRGLERGGLTQKILDLLRSPGASTELKKIKSEKKRKQKYEELVKIYNARWDKIWSNLSLFKYKKPGLGNHWIWDYNFYNAKIEELEYILKLITEVE